MRPALLGLLAALATAFGACRVADYATPDERVELVEAEERSQEAMAAHDAALDAALAAMDELTAALASGEAPRIAQAVEASHAAIDGAEAAGVTAEAMLEAYERKHGAIKDRVAEQAGTVLLPWLPAPLNGPLGMLGIQLAAMLGFDRSRKHLKDAAVLAAKGKVLEALKALLKSAGFQHSTPGAEYQTEMARVSGELPTK